MLTRERKVGFEDCMLDLAVGGVVRELPFARNSYPVATPFVYVRKESTSIRSLCEVKIQFACLKSTGNGAWHTCRAKHRIPARWGIRYGLHGYWGNLLEPI